MFRLVSADTTPSDAFSIHIVILHRLTSRPTLRDLARILERLALRKAERLSIVLDVPATTPKAVAKAAKRLCARHRLHLLSIERPLVAVAKAVETLLLRANDVVCVLNGVVPKTTEFVSCLVAGVEATDLPMLTLAPASNCCFTATAGLIAEFAEHSPFLAKHPDADVLLACFCARGDLARAPLDLRSEATGDYIVDPLPQHEGPEVTPSDIQVLETVLSKLGLHATPQQIPVLHEAAAEARRRLTRAVAAHFRDDIDEDGCIHEILHHKFTGILPYCRWNGTASKQARNVVPAIMLEIGVRELSEAIGMKCNSNHAFRCALMVEFPEVRERMEELKRRAERLIATNAGLRDKVRSGNREREHDA